MRNSSIWTVKTSCGRQDWLAAVALGLLVLATASCSFGPTRVQAPSIDASGASRAAMKLYDADDDGILAANELDQVPGLKAAIKTLDTDQDGKVSASEIAERIRTWQGSRIGIAAVLCEVKLDGRPLSDAEITFEPEAFLGEHVQAGSGTTDSFGAAFPRIPKEKRPTPDTPGGLQLGFYRVKVSKIVNGKETVPEIYNEKTILGQQIAPDDPALISRKIKLDLKSKLPPAPPPPAVPPAPPLPPR